MEIDAIIQKVKTSDKILVPDNAALIGGTKENFLEVGCEILRALVRTTPLKPTSHILEIGSGLGRIAFPLTFYLDGGRYVGVEIVKHMVDFCAEHVTPLAKPKTSFEFLHLDCYNEFYNPESKTQLAEVEFPNLGDFDIVFMSSVCTHLEDKELQLYIQKAAKWLRPGGTFWATFFLIDELAEQQLKNSRQRSSLPFDLSVPGPDYYLDQRRSTLAVAYYPDYVKFRLAESGLLATATSFGSWSGVRKDCGTQDLIVANKVAPASLAEREALQIILREYPGQDAAGQKNAGAGKSFAQAVFDPQQILLLANRISRKVNRSVGTEEVEHAAGLMQSRMGMPDLLAAYTHPDPPVRDVERALLEINAEQADADGNKDLAELYRRLAALAATNTPTEDGWKAMVAEADRATGAGRMEDALAILMECAGKYPRQKEVLALLATVLSFRKRYTEATTVLRQATACAPEDARLHAMLGTMMTLLGDLPAAAAAYARALQIDPGYEEAQTNLTLVRKNIAKLASAGALPASGAFLEQARAKERSMEAYADIIQEGFPRESVTAAPPDGLVTRIMGSADINAYRDTGKSVYLDLSMILLKYFQKTWTDFDAILDFGVGSGRIARWLPARAQAKLYGVDVHAESIRWCRKHLIGAYSMHADDPPLAFAEDTFDCVYGFAVFSHMDNETAGKWIRELHRVIKPGGIVLASAHLSWASSKILNPEEWARYQEQGYVYREFTATGADIVDPLRAVNAFVTERHFWEMWKDDFELIGITAGNSKRENVPVDWEYEKPQFDMGQGVAVLRKIT